MRGLTLFERIQQILGVRIHVFATRRPYRRMRWGRDHAVIIGRWRIDWRSRGPKP